MIRKSMGVQPMAGGSRGALVELGLRWGGILRVGRRWQRCHGIPNNLVFFGKRGVSLYPRASFWFWNEVLGISPLVMFDANGLENYGFEKKINFHQDT